MTKLKVFLSLILTSCVLRAEPGSLAWWLLPYGFSDLPHEIEEDDLGIWSEIWQRPNADPQVNPTSVMEQGIGVRWIGMNFDKSGAPGRVVIVFLGRHIVDVNGEQVRVGSINEDSVVWKEGAKENFYEFRRRRGRRGRRRAERISFGKVALPPLASKTKDLNPWAAEGLSRFLDKISAFPDAALSSRDLSALAQLTDHNGSVLGFHFGQSCDFAMREKLENALAYVLDQELTCWIGLNSAKGSVLIAALMQHPLIECKQKPPMNSEHLGMATIPYTEGFFLNRPQINISVKHDDDLRATLLHEILHLAGLHEADVDSAIELSQSCSSNPSQLLFEKSGEGFFNDSQAQTRISIFRRIKDEAVEKWGWSKGERDFFLGTICTKMEDKFCSRRYFQQAVEENLPGTIELPEGGTVTLTSLARFNLFDSISEDIYRMHELVVYLKYDPNGTLLRRVESGTYRLHEFHVARTALESVKNNKGICTSETDEHIMCEDLAQLVKTPWFKNP